jgi:hypothetical protein
MRDRINRLHPEPTRARGIKAQLQTQPIASIKSSVPPIQVGSARIKEDAVPSSKCYLLGLPFELLQEIAGYLPLLSRASFCKTCRTVSEACYTDAIVNCLVKKQLTLQCCCNDEAVKSLSSISRARIHQPLVIEPVWHPGGSGCLGGSFKLGNLVELDLAVNWKLDGVCDGMMFTPNLRRLVVRLFPLNHGLEDPDAETDGHVTKFFRTRIFFNLSHLILIDTSERKVKWSSAGLSSMLAFLYKHQAQLVTFTLPLRWSLGVPSETKVQWYSIDTIKFDLPNLREFGGHRTILNAIVDRLGLRLLRNLRTLFICGGVFVGDRNHRKRDVSYHPLLESLSVMVEADEDLILEDLSDLKAISPSLKRVNVMTDFAVRVLLTKSTCAYDSFSVNKIRR